MNRRFPRSTLVNPAPAHSLYDGVTDADLAVFVEREIATASNLPLPKFPPLLSPDALALLNRQVAVLLPWAATLTDARLKKAVLAALDRRRAEADAGLDAILSADALLSVPPVPTAPAIP